MKRYSIRFAHRSSISIVQFVYKISYDNKNTNGPIGPCFGFMICQNGPLRHLQCLQKVFIPLDLFHILLLQPEFKMESHLYTLPHNEKGKTYL